MRPPVGAVGDEIGTPDLVGDVPLRGLGIIVVADLGEVALLPDAAVDQRDVVFGEFDAAVSVGEIGNDGVGMLARIAHHVGHRRLLPALVDIGVARLAGPRPDVLRRRLYLRGGSRGLRLSGQTLRGG